MSKTFFGKHRASLPWKIPIYLFFLVMVSWAGFSQTPQARADTETLTVSCGHSASFTPGMACNTFQDVTIDMSRVEKIELTGSSLDDYGWIRVTSDSGTVKTLNSTNGCPGSAGAIPNQDITPYFGPTGSYTVRIMATDDPNPLCGTNVSGSANLRVTYKSCRGTNSPACDTPGNCQIGPGECVVVDGAEACRYPASPQGCDADGDSCTYDFCKAGTDGTTATCTPGTNICGGMVPCGRLADDPSTPTNDESKDCSFCHLALVANGVIDYLFKIASTVALLALVFAGLLYILSAGNPSKKNAARSYVANILKGYAMVFLAFLIVDFILSAWGFLNPIGSEWHVIC